MLFPSQREPSVQYTESGYHKEERFDMSCDHGRQTCAAVATWSFGALAVEECAPLLMSGLSALDAVEKGINKVACG